MPHLPVHIQKLPGKDLTVQQLQAMGQLRSSVMQLKPGLDLARDFEKFCAFCTSCQDVCLFYAPDGELVGTVSFRLVLLQDTGGRDHWFINPDYVFMRADYRGHPAFARNALTVIAGYLLKWRGEAIWFGGIGYPAALMFTNDMCGPIALSCDPPQPDMGRQLIVQLMQECGSNWDAQRDCVCMPTIPPNMGARWQARAASDPMYQRYVAACPNWQDGYALVGIARLRPLPTLARILGKGLRRMLGRRAT